MPLSDDDFATRSAAFRRRSEALRQANRSEDRLNTAINAVCFTLVALVLSLYLGGNWMSTKGLVAGLVAVFIVRWLGRLIVAIFWTSPTLKRINEESPAPPPREP
jgi:NhaP-type Na+/H+ or K+/H+ antiporter